MKKRMLYGAILALALIAAAICLPAIAQPDSGLAELPAIAPEEAVKRMEDGSGGAIVDVRTREEYDEAHIPGALLVPLEEIGSARPEALPDLGQELYVYCRTGVRSRIAVEKLAAMGYSEVYDMGGIVDWPYETRSTAQEQEAEAENALLGNFTATDLDGNWVDQTLFQDYDLTMINIWATYCPPCLEEMPDLGQLSEDFKDRGVQVLGLVSDAANYDGGISESQVEIARGIVERTGANYRHLLPSEDLINLLLWQVDTVPTTIFVDRRGALVGYAYIGSNDYAGWARAIEDTLPEI